MSYFLLCSETDSILTVRLRKGVFVVWLSYFCSQPCTPPCPVHHWALYTVPCVQLYTWSLHTEHCTLQTAHYSLHISCCTLYTTKCTQHTSHYTTHTVPNSFKPKAPALHYETAGSLFCSSPHKRLCKVPCTVMHCILLHCAALYCNALHRTALCCIVL